MAADERPQLKAGARAIAAAYDAEAEATGWRGPEVALGLAFRYIRPGESVLDLGIGTGLVAELFRHAGLRVSGMDLAEDMLDACRTKGFTDLVRCDLTKKPYPFSAGSFDHAVCMGVLNFIGDPSTVFVEVARVLRRGGVFVFAVGDRGEGEGAEYVVNDEHGAEGDAVTMYRHSLGQVRGWLAADGFILLRDLVFDAFMDHERARRLPVHAYAASNGERVRPTR